ncbi:MAG: hypothetical protein Q8R28_15180 [Dehalococcoidia bacterium]|nr:hypothetical protein [Dehalococcoidia bacterium]
MTTQAIPAQTVTEAVMTVLERHGLWKAGQRVAVADAAHELGQHLTIRDNEAAQSWLSANRV